MNWFHFVQFNTCYSFGTYLLSVFGVDYSFSSLNVYAGKSPGDSDSNGSGVKLGDYTSPGRSQGMPVLLAPEPLFE